MKNHSFISILILTTLSFMTIGCQKDKLDYPQLVDGPTFNQNIPTTATSVVFEYNSPNKAGIILSTPNSPCRIYAHLDGTKWHITTPASTIYANPRCEQMFCNCSRLTSIHFGSGFNTSHMVSMTRVVDTSYIDNYGSHHVLMRLGMFKGCSRLSSLDLSSFNTSHVTDMRGLFENCSSITSLDLTSFNTSNVKHMDAMFLKCTSLASVDLSSFNTSNVITMGFPFTEAHNYSSPHSPTQTPTPPSGMFAYCHSLTNLNLSSFNTSNVTNMYTMFFECINMTRLNLSNFDVEHTSLNSIFSGIYPRCFAYSSGACTIICTEATQAKLEPRIDSSVVVTWMRP